MHRRHSSRPHDRIIALAMFLALAIGIGITISALFRDTPTATPHATLVVAAPSQPVAPPAEPSPPEPPAPPVTEQAQAQTAPEEEVDEADVDPATLEPTVVDWFFAAERSRQRLIHVGVLARQFADTLKRGFQDPAVDAAREALCVAIAALQGREPNLVPPDTAFHFGAAFRWINALRGDMASTLYSEVYAQFGRFARDPLSPPPTFDVERDPFAAHAWKQLNRASLKRDDYQRVDLPIGVLNDEPVLLHMYAPRNTARDHALFATRMLDVIARDLDPTCGQYSTHRPLCALITDDTTWAMLRDDYGIAPGWAAGVYGGSYLTATTRKTLIHELAHRVVEEHWPRRQRWLNEGYASYIGYTLAAAEGALPYDMHDVIATCRRFARAGELPSLARLLGYSAYEFYVHPHVSYSMAASVIYFLRHVAPNHVDEYGQRPFEATWNTLRDDHHRTGEWLSHDDAALAKAFLAWLGATTGGNEDAFLAERLDGGIPRTAADLSIGGPAITPTLTAEWVASLRRLDCLAPAPRGGADVTPSVRVIEDDAARIEAWIRREFELLVTERPLTRAEIRDACDRRARFDAGVLDDPAPEPGEPRITVIVDTWIIGGAASSVVFVLGGTAEDQVIPLVEAPALLRGDGIVPRDRADNESELTSLPCGIGANTPFEAYLRQWRGDPGLASVFTRHESAGALMDFLESTPDAIGLWPAEQLDLGERLGKFPLLNLRTDAGSTIGPFDRGWPYRIDLYVYAFGDVAGANRDLVLYREQVATVDHGWQGYFCGQRVEPPWRRGD